MTDSEASAFLFVASYLSNQFELPGKRSALTVPANVNNGSVVQVAKL